MEGAAIAQAAHAAGRPFMVIRAMSDTADHAAIFLLMDLSLRLANALLKP